MNSILVFLETIFVNWIAFGAILTAGLISERGNNQGCSVFFGALSVVVAFFMFKLYDFSWQSITTVAVVYALVGIVWSFWRYKQYVTNAITEFDNYKPDWCTPTDRTPERKKFVEKLKPSEHWDAITGWVIVWPFSFVEYGLGDVFTIVKTFISSRFCSIYNKIYQNAVGIKE